jgi:threonine synthase
VLVASDDEILQAARDVARRGLALELASALAVACARRVMGEASAQETWIALGTEAAAKWPEIVTRDFQPPPRLPPDFDDLDALSLSE